MSNNRLLMVYAGEVGSLLRLGEIAPLAVSLTTLMTQPVKILTFLAH